MKYIDADKLVAEIERRMEINKIGAHNAFRNGKVEALRETLEYANSLQQEQPEVQNGKFVFPKYLYARTKDNKTIDMSYAPQDMTAVEYIRNDFVEQEQPMPDSTKLIELWHADKEMLKEKDFRNDPWRLAYNAFMCGFGRGLAVNKQEQPEVDLEKEITDKSRACCNCVNGISQYPNCYCWQHEYCNTDEPYKIPKEDWVDTAKTCKKFELELGLNARKEE